MWLGLLGGTVNSMFLSCGCVPQATGWKLDDAVQLFYVGNEGGGVESSFLPRQNNGTTRWF